MFKKIYKVFYGTDCLPYKDKECTVHYPITGNSFLGASNSVEIRFYIDKIGSIDDTWVANSKLPNGKMGNQIFESTTKGNDDDGNYLALELSSFYTQAKGDVYISLNGFYGGVEIDDSGDVPVIVGTPTIQATGCIKLSVYYATPLIAGDDIAEITLAQVLAEVGTRLPKNSNKYLKVIDNITQINNDPNNAEFFFANDIVYCKTAKEFYAISGTFPSLTYSAIRLYIGSLEVDNLFAEYIQVSGELEVKDFSKIISFDGDEEETLPEYIQELIDIAGANYVKLTGDQTINGVKTFTRTIIANAGVNLANNGQVWKNNVNVFAIGSNALTKTHYKFPYADVVNNQHGVLNPYTIALEEEVDSNFAHSIDLSIDSNYDLVVKLLDKNGNELSRDDIDLPLESIVVSATYYDTYTYDGTTYSKVIVIVLATTDVPTIVPVGDLVSGLATTTYVSEQLANYYTSSQVDTLLASYVTTTALGTALADYVQTSRTIAGIALSSDISSQALTDALVFATNSDIENIMED